MSKWSCKDELKFVSFSAIKTHSPDNPALVFVSSRRQTRLTAIDLTTYIVAEDNPQQWVHMSDQEVILISVLIKLYLFCNWTEESYYFVYSKKSFIKAYVLFCPKGSFPY